MARRIVVVSPLHVVRHVASQRVLPPGRGVVVWRPDPTVPRVADALSSREYRAARDERRVVTGTRVLSIRKYGVRVSDCAVLRTTAVRHGCHRVGLGARGAAQRVLWMFCPARVC